MMGLERIVEWNGETLTAMEWSNKTGIPFKILIARLNMGWTAEKALTKIVRGWRKGHRRGMDGKDPEYEKDDDKGHRKAFLDTEYGDQGGII